MCVLLMVVLVVWVSELIGHALAFFKNGFLDFIEVIHVLCLAERHSMSCIRMQMYACDVCKYLHICAFVQTHVQRSVET